MYMITNLFSRSGTGNDLHYKFTVPTATSTAIRPEDACNFYSEV
jgi:hypothetical protein